MLEQSFSLFQNEKVWARFAIEDEPLELILLISAAKLKCCKSVNLAEISEPDEARTFQKASALLENLSVPVSSCTSRGLYSKLFILCFPPVYQPDMLWTFLRTITVIWQNIFRS